MAAFRCRPYGATLTPAACAARHERAGRSTGGDLDAARSCVDCQVGAAHAAGGELARWPDGVPVERLVIARVGAEVPMPPARERPVRPEGRPAKWADFTCVPRRVVHGGRRT